MRTLLPGKTEGYVLLRTLTALFAALLCFAAVLTAVSSLFRENLSLLERTAAELRRRNAAVEEWIR
ncbi:MAG: hypothetical protein LBO80_01430 [Treponema sp.]|jgi:hypothetical protein|nr:hypothetical protein [Treponema sp.]